jgi:prepilin-type N-terminal cleavage/methylation domain-containing protein/prepilin-type processing-associated H-X9-DG protein
MHRNRKSAFTLIELLVVVAIIASIAAILFPVFSRAREAARKSGCLSNLKQIGMATRMYIDDYDETFPFVLNFAGNGAIDANIGDDGKRPAVRGVTGAEPQFRLVTVVSPYVRNENVWYCPSVGPNYVWEDAVKVSAWKKGMTMRDQGTTYGYTYVSFPRTGKEGLITLMGGKRYNILSDPSRWPMLWDQPNGWAYTGSASDPPASVVPHFGGVNISYGDGHAKYLRMEAAESWVLIRHSGDGLFPGQ